MCTKRHILFISTKRWSVVAGNQRKPMRQAAVEVYCLLELNMLCDCVTRAVEVIRW